MEGGCWSQKRPSEKRLSNFCPLMLVNYGMEKLIPYTIKSLTLATVILAFSLGSCKKDPPPSNNGGGGSVTPPRESKLSMLTKTWILKETFKDDAPQTSNGTSKYRFTRDGKFDYLDNGNWGTIGSYYFNDRDSNSVSVLFTGSSMSIWWYFKKFDAGTLNTEFNVQGHKYNYNYIKD